MNEGEIRSAAVATVDRRHGYTYEFSSSPEAHLQEYDDEERVCRLLDGRTGTLKAVFTDLRTGASSERETPYSFVWITRLYEWYLHVEGPTGYESAPWGYLKQHAATGPHGFWLACAGAPGRWLECRVPMAEIARIAKEIEGALQ